MPVTPKCKKCRAELLPGWAFCPHCGRKVS